MSKIKFRIWDKKVKRFIEWYNPDPMINCEGKIFCYERTTDPETDLPGEDFLSNERDADNVLDLQLYSGLKDCKGKEIYEGDIVKVVLFCIHDGEEVRIGVVKTKDNPISFYHTVDLSPYSSINYWNMLEVIGNIYENPEMLT